MPDGFTPEPRFFRGRPIALPVLSAKARYWLRFFAVYAVLAPLGVATLLIAVILAVHDLLATKSPPSQAQPSHAPAAALPAAATGAPDIARRWSELQEQILALETKRAGVEADLAKGAKSDTGPKPTAAVPGGPTPVLAKPVSVTPVEHPAPPPAAPAAGPSLIVHYRAGSAPAEADAERLAARFKPEFGRTELRAETDLPRKATVQFFSADAHAAARRLASELGSMGYPWQIENDSGRAPHDPPSTTEIWLPSR